MTTDKRRPCINSCGPRLSPIPRRVAATTTCIRRPKEMSRQKSEIFPSWWKMKNTKKLTGSVIHFRQASENTIRSRQSVDQVDCQSCLHFTLQSCQTIQFPSVESTPQKYLTNAKFNSRLGKLTRRVLKAIRSNFGHQGFPKFGKRIFANQGDVRASMLSDSRVMRILITGVSPQFLPLERTDGVGWFRKMDSRLQDTRNFFLNLKFRDLQNPENLLWRLKLTVGGDDRQVRFVTSFSSLFVLFRTALSSLLSSPSCSAFISRGDGGVTFWRSEKLWKCERERTFAGKW